MKLFKPKITVEIVKGPPNHIVRKKCPIVENYAIIEPSKRGPKGHPEWKVPLLEGAVLYDGFFKKPKIMVMDGATEPVRFLWEKVEENGESRYGQFRPKINLGRIDVKQIFDAEVIRKMGQIKVKYETPILFWLLLGFQALQLFITFLIANRFGVL